MAVLKSDSVCSIYKITLVNAVVTGFTGAGGEGVSI